MANIKAGLTGVVATAVVVIVELLLFPVVLNGFLGRLNSTASGSTSYGASCTGTQVVNCSGEWIGATERTILRNVPTLITVIVLFTILGGVIGSVYVAVKG